MRIDVKREIQDFTTFIKNRIWSILGIAIITMVVVARIDLESLDLYWMVAHGKDMLENSLVRTTDIFSMHENLPFMYQKWAMCILTYLLYSHGGMIALRCASNILAFSVFYFIYTLVNHISPKTKPLNIILLMPIFCGMLSDTLFRPHAIAALFLLWELSDLERYVKHNITDKRLYLDLAIISFCIMWFHSTMWYVCIIFILPYICDIKYIVDGVKMNQYPIIKHVKYIAYEKKQLLIGLGIMVITSLLQPCGILQYKYMAVCLTANGEKYSHISELHPIDIFSSKAFCMYVIIAFILYLAHKYKCVQLRCVYMTFGGILMAGIADRLFFYSAMLFAVVIGNQMSEIITDEKLANVNEQVIAKWMIILNASVMLLCITWIGIVGYLTITYDLIKVWDKSLGYDMVPLLQNNVTCTQNLKLYTDMELGSYLIANDMKPYIDCRAEVYDINLNGTVDILGEYHELLLGSYKGADISELSTLQQFQQDYDFDYYLIPKREYGEGIMISALHDNIRQNAYCNYEDEYYGIYSFKDNRAFAH